MADSPQTPPSPNKSDESPKSSIQVVTSKSAGSDDRKIEVKVSPLGDKNVSIEIKKGQGENEDKQDENDPIQVKPITDEEVEEIVSKYKSIDEKDLKKYLDFFWSVDEYKFGAFTVHQLAYRLGCSGHRLTNQQIARMFSDLDQDNDMLVSLDEFLTDMAKPKRQTLSKSELKVWFDRFDTDHDGYVTRKDIMETVESLGAYMLTPHLDEFMKHDRSGNMERLDFEEFCFAYKMSPQ
ncbi:CALL5-like protein [Mya arenaria]|uniref:CALL5-like protein n=1 Tax=Mya arenaria TaxID=6604 RepID=A0ABY7DF08_MYAAR|nr:uncharacterized protein LOC128236015 [Mya arenaria]WAQ95014.1 CALL5-like protein [Mya arenaria]